MRKLLTTLAFFAVCMTALGQFKKVSVDLEDATDKFTIEAKQGDSMKLRVFTFQGGNRLTLTNGWGAVAGYATNWLFSTSMDVLVTNTPPISTNSVDFLFSATDLDTNGGFLFQLSFTNATERYTFDGELQLERNPIALP